MSKKKASEAIERVDFGNREIMTLIKYVGRAIERNGGLKQFLSRFNGFSSFTKDMTEACINCTCEEYNIRFKELVESPKYEHVQARKLCFIIIKKYTGITGYDIAVIFKTDHTLVYKHIKEMDVLEPRIKDHARIIERRDKICGKLNAVEKDLLAKFSDNPFKTKRL